MKTIIVYLIILWLSGSIAFAQVGINSDNSSPDPSAGLDVKFSDKGFLPPRMSTLQRDQILDPATGLMIFNTDCNDYQYYKGTGWVSMGNFGQIPQPASISGNPSPCVFANGIIYSTAPIPDANSYQWTVPAGASITSGQGTNYISVDYGTLGGSICVTAHNECYNSLPLCIPINLISLVNASITISAGATTVCQGIQVTFTSSVINQGFAPMYQWKKNNMDIPGATNNSFSYIPQHNDKISCRLISNETCVSSPTVYSNYITMTVLPNVEAAITISTADLFCEGAMATIGSVITTGLPEPQYQWRLNSINIPGATNNSYSYIPQEGDSISCMLTSNGLCVAGSPTISNTLIVNITQHQPVSVVIIASENPVTVGTSVTYTATATNGGNNPTYLWKVNGLISGINSNTYSYTPANQDSIVCEVTSDANCVSGSPATSNTIVMLVNSITGIPCPGITTVIYGGTTYNTVRIGEQCWLKENLNIGTKISGDQNQNNNGIIEKYCYDNLDSNCTKFGGLYQWNEMMGYVGSGGTNPVNIQGICPPGWHLPSDTEWCQLISLLDPSFVCDSTGHFVTNAGGMLKHSEFSYWDYPNAGANNLTGFSAKAGGYRRPVEIDFLHLMWDCYFWTSTENDLLNAKDFGLYHVDTNVFHGSYGKLGGLSVRCIKNE